MNRRTCCIELGTVRGTGIIVDVYRTKTHVVAVLEGVCGISMVFWKIHDACNKRLCLKAGIFGEFTEDELTRYWPLIKVFGKELSLHNIWDRNYRRDYGHRNLGVSQRLWGMLMSIQECTSKFPGTLSLTKLIKHFDWVLLEIPVNCITGTY